MLKWCTIWHGIQTFIRGISMLVFPSVCVCCGLETTEEEQQLCSFCKQERFEPACRDNALSSSGVILPEAVRAQFALWQFDQGGVLQELLHFLKYEHLAGIGVELGKKLGENMRRHPAVNDLLTSSKAILVPVPLHYLKFKQRGYNQAFMIARGVGETLDIPVCDIKAVTRSRNTLSQTGFSLQKRIANLKEAFEVRAPWTFQNKLAVIIDDVFTTGSTSFELARTLKRAGCQSIIIATVAQA